MGKIDELIKDFNRQYKETIMSKGIDIIKTKKIPFSSPRINYMTYGGLPRGRIIEFSGEENGGKTTTALDIVANAQQLFFEEWTQEIDDLELINKLNKTQQERLNYLKQQGPQKIVYADCENTLEENWAKQLGVNVEELIVLKPQSQSAEQIFEIMIKLISTGEVGLSVLDSIGVMLSGLAFEKTMEEKTYGGIAQSLTLFGKKAEMLCAKHGSTFIGINQMRADLNSQHGGTMTTGGKGWKHVCIVRLSFRKGNFIDNLGNELRRNAEEPVGNIVQVAIEKTKAFKPDRRIGFYTLNYSEGIDWISDTAELAIKYGMINRAGAWYTFIDLETGEIIEDENGETIKLQGKASLLEYLKANVEILSELTDNIQLKLESQ